MRALCPSTTRSSLRYGRACVNFSLGCASKILACTKSRPGWSFQIYFQLPLRYRKVEQMNPAVRLVRNYGIALIVVAALIWFPFTGFWLTILTLGLLPSLVCNLFLIHLAIAAGTGGLPRGWLAVPILCYGAWLGWLVWQTHTIDREISTIEGENRVAGPIEQNVTLVFPKDDELAIRARRHLAPPLRVFMGPIELPAVKESSQVCASVLDVLRARCATDPSSTPPPGAIVFHQLEYRHQGSGIYRYRYELTRNSSAVAIGHFNFGTLSAPAWGPLFRAGCYLIDNPPAWRCATSAMLRKVTFGQTGSASPYDPLYEKSDPVIATLAKMLGVK
jgi:hypothetical protein